MNVHRTPLHDGERRLRQSHDDFDELPPGTRESRRACAREQRQERGGKNEEADE